MKMKMNKIQRKTFDKVSRIVDKRIILTLGKVKWQDIAESIKKSFKDEIERNLAFIYLGYKMGREFERKMFLKQFHEFIPITKDLAKQLIREIIEGD